MTDSGYVNPQADWRVLLDGEDLTDRIAPRLISLKVTEKLSESADQLDLELHGHDGLLAIPKAGAIIQVKLGWLKGSGVEAGLIDKGRYKVDDAEYTGSPDKIIIRARSADFDERFRTRRDKSWKGKSIEDILDDIAKANGLEARIHPELSGIIIPVLDQASMSDMTLLRNLGRRYDATSTVKDRTLIFAPADATKTASGKDIPAIALVRSDGDGFRYKRSERGSKYKGVEAKYRSQKRSKRETVKLGDGPRKRIKRTYATKADAEAAAKAELQRIKRSGAEFSYALAYGNAALYPGQKVTLSGWKAEVDGKKWQIAETNHKIGPGGFVSDIELELAG